MDLERNWTRVRAAFEAGIATSRHAAVATVSADGFPHVTPIGFVFLRDDRTAFYFEEYAQRLRENLERDPRVCLMTVDTGAWFWLKSLVKGRFDSPPGVRIKGIAGARRPATDDEKAAYRARVRSLRSTRGYELIWRDLSHVRDIRLESFAPVVYPGMTEGLWVE